MAASTFESVASQMAIASIATYRKHLSPRKGFSCPHGLLYGESCSDRVQHLFMTQDLRSAIQAVPQQFRACKLAAQTLSQQSSGGCIVVPCCLPI